MDEEVEIAGVGVTDRTVFLLGNGPSLRDVQLADLSDHLTIGMNAAYRYWDEIDWYPTHYACLDLVVGLSHRHAIARLIEEGRIERFLLRSNLIEALGEIGYDKRVINFDALCTRVPILATSTVTTGSHSALWAASSLGCCQVVLLGIDGRYVERVDGAKARGGIELEMVEDGENPNYFFDGYQRKGDRYNVPNPRPGLHIEAWAKAGNELSAAEIAVYNGNASSAVRYFPFIDLNAFLAGSAEPVAADEPLPPPEETGADLSSSRPMRFARRQGTPLAMLGLLFVMMGGLVGVFGDWDPGLILAYSFLSGSFFGLILLILYTRFAVTEHLGWLQAGFDDLTARLDELDRQRHISD